MENNVNTESIRALLSQGDTGKAIQLLIALVEKDSRFKDNLLRALRVTEANFNAARQQELKGILPFQEAQREYNKVNDTLLAVLDDFEAGRVPSLGSSAVDNRRKWIWAGLGAALLLVLVAIWLVWGRNAGCPEFENGQALHVMILPFDPLTERVAKPELRIQDEIQGLTKKAGFPAEVKVKVQESKGLVNSQDAARIALECNVNLVVFGQYQAFENDSIRVKMGFRFLNNGKEFSGPFKTFRDITAVQPTRDLQDAVFSLCAMIAIENEKLPVAKRWMERIHDKDSEEEAMSAWLDQQGQK